MRTRTAALITCLLFCAVPLAAEAQTAPAATPEKPTTGNVSAGLALTSGNKDTYSVNAGYEVKYDPHTRNVVKSAGLLLIGGTEGESTAEQYTLSVRDEYAFRPRAFVFGDLRYLHDRFKGIDYLLSPTGGVGYKAVDTPATALAVSAGLGLVSEKDQGTDLDTTGAVTADEKLSHKLSETTTLGQTFSALWKMSGFGDALYGFGVNLVAAITKQAQLKVELLDTYKTRPVPTRGKNDVTLLTGVVFKF